MLQANRVVARAAQAPAAIVGRCFCTAQAAARHLAHALSRPEAKDALEMALGLCLMALVTQKALRVARYRLPAAAARGASSPPAAGGVLGFALRHAVSCPARHLRPPAVPLLPCLPGCSRVLFHT